MKVINTRTVFSALIGLSLLSLLVGNAQSSTLPEFVPLVEKYGPAVVNISTTQTKSLSHRMPKGLPIPDLPEDNPFSEFFRHFFDERGGGFGMVPEEERKSRSLGSGFLISEDGYVMTNHHVVEGADEVIVRTSDRKEYVAKLIGSDKRSDVALLKIDANNMPTVKMGESTELKVGEWVLAIGSPFGFDHSATAGIVSAKGRNLPSENYVPFIQTDVAINPGNSGGPLFNLDGEVVGVNSQIYSRTGGFMGLSFAIPIDMAMNVVDQLKNKGRVTRGWLGVMIQDVNRELAESFGMPSPRGALVAQILDDSPAKKAGVEVGDIILAFNGKKVGTSSELPPLVGASRVDKPAELDVLRGGKTITLQVNIGELPPEDQLEAAATTPEPSHTKADRLGVTVSPLTAENRQSLGAPSAGGVMVDSVEGGPAQAAGIRAGDVILMLNNWKIKDADQFRDIVKDLPENKSIRVLVHRESGPIFLALKLGQG